MNDYEKVRVGFLQRFLVTSGADADRFGVREMACALVKPPHNAVRCTYNPTTNTITYWAPVGFAVGTRRVREV